jgi:hypothetical protein
MRLASVLFLVTLLLPGTASAAEISLTLEQPEVQYGTKHRAEGRLVEGTSPLAGRTVQLQGRAYPYDGPFRTVATTTTDANGAYAFTKKFDRNFQLQAVVPDAGAVSRVVRAYVFPRPRSVFTALSRNRLKITQFLRTPPNVKLSARTNFYLARQGAASARRVARAKPRRVGRGRFKAVATVKLPRSWNGRFKYASCFRYSEGSGLGNPGASCPKRWRFAK